MSEANPPAPPVSSPVAESKPPADVDLNSPAVKAAIEAALKADREGAAEKTAKEKDAADAEAAKQRGEFQKLYEAEKSAREATEKHNRDLRRSAMLTECLSSEHPDYLTHAEWIAPTIPPDLEGDALAKMIRERVKKYVELNPRTSARPLTAGVPSLRAGSRMSPTRQPNQRTSTPGVASSRF